MDVLVTGGTGFIGRHLCRALRDRGHEVTALSRSESAEDLPDGVNFVAGDVTDYETLPSAIEGYDAVVHLVSLSPLYTPPGGSRQREQVTVGGTRNVIRAMNDTGVDRLLFLSGLGADPDGRTAFIRAKGRAEAIIRAADVQWTIVRPSVVFGPGDEFVPFVGRVTTPYVTALPGGGATRFQPIWVGDFVDLLATALEGPEHVGQTYDIGGPEKLTLADVTTLVHRGRGRSVTIVPVPMPLARIALTAAGILPKIPFGPEQYRSLTFDNTTDRNDVTSLGGHPEELTSLGSYLSYNTHYHPNDGEPL